MKIPWPFYKDIFLFARDKEIPLIDLNIPREITKKVSQNGFQSLTKKEIGKLPSEITCNVDDAYMKFIKRAYSVHDYKNNFTNFCEAQILWDSIMAFYTIDFIRKNPEYSVVILAGTGHIWKRAIPEQIKKLDGDSYSISVVYRKLAAERKEIKSI